MSVKNKDLNDGHERCFRNIQMKQKEFTKIRAELEQRIQFLEEELKEYREREQNNKKINESIMVTYQQNQNFREEHVNRQISILSVKHQNELKKMKEIYDKQTNLYEETINQYKTKYEQSLIQNDRKSVQFEKKILEFKKKFENDLKKELQEKQNEMESKVQILMEKLKQSEGMAALYQEFMQKRREGFEEQNQNYSRIPRESYGGYTVSRDQSLRKFNTEIENEIPERCSRKSRIKDIQEHNMEDRKRLSASRQSVKQLTVKIDRALTQLKGSNNSKLHERINEKLSKRL